jgi:hypothetical protein
MLISATTVHCISSYTIESVDDDLCRLRQQNKNMCSYPRILRIMLEAMQLRACVTTFRIPNSRWLYGAHINGFSVLY